ncbi:two-component sensor histidine kinase [Cellulosimicrobium cellulans]|uniref:sensor histidine kinase n=1 Tax=Cellulosimicrobium cellulans TaxID=1710 RepID=UPI001962F9BA|nr:histidine kinase [Cellulosimicrobium cellulans]MBN0038838.1 two-component sensor histidine kinase [Cellulosimicrobium cellulans]
MADPGPGRAGMPRTGWTIGVLAWVLGVSALALQLTSGVPLLLGDLLFVVVDATVALVYGTVAAVILVRRPHVVGWLVALAGIGGGVAALGGAWRSYASTHPGLPPLAPLADAYGWAWVPGTVGLFVLVPWFVRGARLGTGAWCGVAGGAASIAFFFLAPTDDPRPAIVGVVAMGLVTAAATAWRWRRGPVGERRGLGLLALGTALMALSFLPLLGTWADPDVLLALPLTHLACQALFPAAILVCVLRNRLWGIDLVLSRATVAAMLAVGLAVVYTVVVVLATTVVDGPAAQILAAVGVALAVQPLHTWLRHRVRTLVYGEGNDPGRAALSVGRHLSSASTADDLVVSLAVGVREALRLESVTIERAPDPPTGPGVPEDRPGSAWAGPTSRSTGQTASLPVTHGGRVLGRVHVVARAGERLDARTRDALDQLLPVLGAGLALAQGARELEEARDATTRARLAERRVIRRELHDGVGPWLVGLRLGLQGARNTLETDPAAAAAVLDALGAEVAQRVEDVRALSRSLLPPSLDEHGLEVALGELAGRQALGGFVVDVRCDPCDGLDPRVAAAAYAIASESVVNAARHSGAGECRLTVRLGDGCLVVTCEDDGSGIAPEATRGVGSRSLRERTDELGGRLEVTAARADDERPGTRVRATLPLVPAGALAREGAS